MTKYIFVTGGVVSGLGKGITAASLGRLLKARGLKVAAQKPLRIQGCFVSDSEIESVVDFVKNSRSVIYDDSIAQELSLIHI